MEALDLFATIRPGNFQGELIAAAEIERRAIECDEGWRLGGEALLEIGSFEHAAFDGHSPVRGGRGKPDRRQGAGGTIRANIGVDADPKVLSRRGFEFPLGDISLRLRGEGPQAANDGERAPKPA